MTEPSKAEPEEDLLEFLGGIDEINEDSGGNDFSDFLANADIDRIVRQPEAPVKEGKRE